MGKFFIENREIRECFDALPVEVRNKIIESDLEISSKDELELVAKRLENLSKYKKFYNKCERFLRPYRTYFFMAFAYNEDRATQRCDSSAL